MAAIVFGAAKFHEYIYAKGPIHVETDHRPLESIFKKPLSQMSSRIQIRIYVEGTEIQFESTV